MYTLRRSHFISLHWLPDCFQIQFMLPVWTFKAPHDTVWGQVIWGIVPLWSTCHIRSGRRDLLWVPSVKESNTMGPRRQAFSAIAPTLWNTIPCEVGLAPPWLPSGKPSVFFNRPVDSLVLGTLHDVDILLLVVLFLIYVYCFNWFCRKF